MKRRLRPDWRAAIALLLATAFVIGSGDRQLFADGLAGTSTTVDDSWNAVFDRREGWTGADCAGTINLGDGRVLWLFGDTWIGSIRGGKRQPGATMVNNSIAIHPIDPSASWRGPNPSSVRFVWGANNAKGEPTAWAVPATKVTDKQPTGESREWLWANGGGLAVNGPGGSRRLFVFFFRVRTNPHGKGVWTFTVAGTTLGVVDNASEPVDRWKLRLLDIPHCPQIKASAGKPTDAEFTWGMAACLDAHTEQGDTVNALIYGIRRSAFLNDALVLARVPATAIDQFQSWRFFAGHDLWSTEAKEAKPIANGMVSEFSVERTDVAKRPLWILVHSEPLLGKRIFVRTAVNPEGPWSARKTVATVRDVDRSRSYFTYAAKGHAFLSRPAELLITYLVNSQEFGDLVNDTTIYRPKFLRFPLSAISAP
jgi:hypothetical protein